MRYFRAPSSVMLAIRSQVMATLSQPNGNAEEPWSETGDFTVEGVSYLSLAPHHTEGQPWEAMIAQALQIEGVEEIEESEYASMRPIIEEI